METRPRARRWGALTLCALAVLMVLSLFPTPAFAGHSHDRPHKDATARLRVVHAVPDVGPVDVYINANKVAADVPFFTVSDYLTLRPGTYRVRVVPAGANGKSSRRSIINQRIKVRADQDYSLVVNGTAANHKVRGTLLRDNNTAPAGGQARLRVAHFSPDAPAVDIFINGELSPVQGLKFRRATGYLEVPAGTYEVGVAPAGGTPIFTAEVTLAAGTVYTAWANGLLGGSGATAFTVTPSEDAVYGQARVRAVHAIPDVAGSPVDVYVNGAKVVTFDFFTVTPYLSLLPGTYDVRVVLAGGDPDTEAVIAAEVTVEDGKDYSIVARGTGGDFGATVLEDDNTAPAAGQARLRVAHFSPDAPAVDIYVNGELSPVQGLSFPEATGYLEVPAGTYEVGVAPAGGTPIFTAEVTLAAGTVYTAWANGLLGGSGATAFTVTPSEDAVYGQARVRAVHAIPDVAGSPVDVYVNGAKVVTFDFFTVTPYLSLLPGTYDVRVVLAGGDPDTEAVIAAEVTVEDGKDYSIVARGTGGDFGATVLEDDNTTPAAGQARLRVAHFSPDAPAVDIFINGELSPVQGLSFPEATGYLEVPAGTYEVGVAPAGGTPIFTAEVTLAAGTVYTAWANGLLGGSGATAFTVTPSVDAE